MARKVLVVQPSRHTMLCENVVNDPIGEDGDQVVREHTDNVPTDGQYDFIFTDTDTIKWRLDGGGWNTGVDVTDDGATWNLDCGTTGLDIKFEPSDTADAAHITVSAAKTKKDTFCFKFSGDQNFGVAATFHQTSLPL